MSGESPAPGSRSTSGLFGSLKALLSTAAAVLQTRLELLANELQEKKLRIVQLGLLAIAAVFFLAFAVLLLTMFVIVAYWDSHRLLAVGGFAALYLFLGIVLAGVAAKRASARSRLFEASLRELARDRERLSS